MKKQGPNPDQFKSLQGSPEVKTGTKTSLRDLLTFVNPNLEKYKEIIERESRNKVFYPQRFSERWINFLYNGYSQDPTERYNPQMFRKAYEFFREKLSDDILIDLGGGDGEIMAQLAKKFGVKTYVSVDLGDNLDPYSAQPLETESDFLSDDQKGRQMTSLGVSADMLDFVARLPDNSANFVLNGIDWDIIRDSEYRAALMAEISRATRKEGIVFGTGTDIVPSDPKFVSKLEGLKLDLVGPETFVLEKAA